MKHIICLSKPALYLVWWTSPPKAVTVKTEMIFRFFRRVQWKHYGNTCVSGEAGETNILETGNGLHPSGVQGGHFMCHDDRYTNKVPAEYKHSKYSHSKGMANQPDI